ncbi:hypothetical protein Tco_1350053 [Tanacetum coccineum]
MRGNKLHKFSDGMLNDVRSALHDIASGIRMEYLLKRKWGNLGKRSARVMFQDIDKKLFERRIMRNLEKFIGGREYGTDLRLVDGDDYDDDGDNDANDDDSDEKRTKSDKDENPNLNQSDEEYEEKDEEYVDERVHTPPDYQLTYEEKDDDEENIDEDDDDEVTKELYKDVNMNLGNRDADMTDADHGGADQQNVS